MKSFSLDEALSGQAESIGRFDWVSEASIAIESIGAYSPDPSLAIVATKGVHDLEEGDFIWVVGHRFKVDGKYKVVDHPAKGVDKTKHFAIECPKGLKGGKLQGGRLRHADGWEVYHPDHLHLEGTTELKKVQMMQAANLKAQAKYLEVMEKMGLLDMKIASLAEKFGVDKADRDKFAQQFQNLTGASDDAVLDEIVSGMIKDFSIKAKAFKKEALKLSQEYKESMLSMIDDFEEMTQDDVLQDFERRQIEIQKREIEILTSMPKGLMSALDNLSSISATIQQIYAYVKEAHARASKAQASGKAEGAKA